MQLAERYMAELTPMKAELDRRAAVAWAIFGDVAGPLNEQSDPLAKRAHRFRNSLSKIIFR